MESTMTSSEYSPELGVEGELTVPIATASAEYRTLDEPVKETILRDLKMVGLKFYHVLYPKKKAALLRDWDLWGPLFLCVFLALILQGSSSDNNFEEGGLQFAEIFVIVWLGAVIVTLNSKLLGGNISFFQSVCVLGYCLLSPCIALLLNMLVPLIFAEGLASFLVKFVFSIIGFGWATLAATVFLGDSQPPRRKALAVYPIFLFYFVISWLIISRS